MRHNTRPDTGKETCSTQPHFAINASGQAQAVTLNPHNYVKLLVDARETDPACWPPGMEEVAGMVARVQEIEDQCVAKHGDFAPEKLARKVQDEYMDLHLALDAISEGETAEFIKDSEPAPSRGSACSTTAPCVLPEAESWPEFPLQRDQENFA
jgi:hypothetical protein